MDVLVDLAAAFIVGRDYQRVLRRTDILAGNLRDTLLPVADLMHPALSVEIADGIAHLAPRKLLDHLLLCWVFLPDDLVKTRRAKLRLLQLRVRPPGLHRLMLPRIAHEEYTVIFP